MVCDGVDGPNLVRDALAALRGAGWEAPPVRVTITKRIPVAAGMGGGSADAAALLRLAPRLGHTAGASRLRIAARLGADVPSQLVPGPWLGAGAGHRLCRRRSCRPTASWSSRSRSRSRPPMSTARPTGCACHARPTSWTPCAPGSPARSRRELIVNDLEPAALSLAPRLGETLGAVVRAGADDAIVCGSGPTVIGLFWGADGPRARERRVAAARRSPRGGQRRSGSRRGRRARRRTNERLAAICAGSDPSTPVMTTFRHNHGCET